MYERFYGFRERPFSLLSDPDFLFLGEKHCSALDLLEMAIFNQSGFCVISGEIGAGKTTLIRELLNRLDDSIRIGLVSNTHPSFGELLQWIMAAYGLKCGSDDQLELHKRFIDFVIEQYAEKKHTLLIIDEAQNLSVTAMEELRMLSNVNSGKDFVLQVILIGQHQLRDKLRKPELGQFAQRIALDYHLDGLNREQTCQYIRHRVSHAGGAPDLFSQSACHAVFRASRGIPRVINRICDLSLVYGYSEESPRITAEIVKEVVEDPHMGSFLDAVNMPTAMPVHDPADMKAMPQVTGRKPRLQQEQRVVRNEDVAVGSLEDTVDGIHIAGAVRQGDHTAMPEQVGEQYHFGKAPDAAGQAVTKPCSDTIEDDKAIHDQDVTDTPTRLERAPADESAPLAVAKSNQKAPGVDSAPADSSGSAGQTVAALMTPGSRPEEGAAAEFNPIEEDDSAPTSRLHELVVDAEQNRLPESNRSALWLLMGVVAMVGVTGWMTRDIWSPVLFGEVISASKQEAPGFLPEKAASSSSESAFRTVVRQDS